MGPRWRLDRRWELCWLLFLARGVCQANRVLLGALMPFLSVELKLSSGQKGSILAAFSTGYMLTQVIGGTASDRFGGKKLTLCAITAMSLGSLAAPGLLSGAGGLQSFWACYFVMGLAEGPSYPTTGSMLSKWIPGPERGAATSIVDTGSSVASMATFALAPIVADAFGWRWSFWCSGLTSLCVCVVWAVRAANRPVEDALITADERQHMLDAGMNPRDVGATSHSDDDAGVFVAQEQALLKKGVKGGRMSFTVDDSPRTASADAQRHDFDDFSGDAGGALSTGAPHRQQHAFPYRLFGYSSAWAVVVAHAAFNFGRYFVYNSIVSFYVERAGATPVVAGRQVLFGQLADTLGKFAFAPFVDRKIKTDPASKTRVRKTVSGLAFLVFAACMLVMAASDSLFSISAALVVCKIASSAHVCGFKTTYLDLTSKHTGALAGVSNTLATFAAMLSPLVTGFLLDAHQDQGWNIMLYLIALVNLLAALFWCTFASADSLDSRVTPHKGGA